MPGAYYLPSYPSETLSKLRKDVSVTQGCDSKSCLEKDSSFTLHLTHFCAQLLSVSPLHLFPTLSLSAILYGGYGAWEIILGGRTVGWRAWDIKVSLCAERENLVTVRNEVGLKRKIPVRLLPGAEIVQIWFIQFVHFNSLFTGRKNVTVHHGGGNSTCGGGQSSIIQLP